MTYQIAAKPWWKFWPLASMLGSSSAVVLGRDVYGDGDRRFIRWVHRRLYVLDRAIWQVRYRVQRKHRYHIVETGLPPGYYDEDERMLRAVMWLVCQHVEVGHGGVGRLSKFTEELRSEPDPNAPEACERQADSQGSIIDVYRWWTEQRPADHAREAEMVHSLYEKRRMKWGKPDANGLVEYLGSEDEPDAPTPICTHQELWAFQDGLRLKDQEMLHRVIDLRPGLWT